MTDEIQKTQVELVEREESFVQRVRIHGSRGDLIIEIDDSVPFAKGLRALEAEFRKAPLFFQDAVARIGWGKLQLSTKQKKSLRDMCAKYKVLYQDLSANYREEQNKANTLMISRTLRSGQRVEYDGHVVILGDVQPGAEVVASGHIIVWGVLRGIAHAGAGGNTKCFVCAMRLVPVQLRIANFVAVDLGSADHAQIKKAEIAHIQDEMIVAEEWDAKTFVKMGVVLEE